MKPGTIFWTRSKRLSIPRYRLLYRVGDNRVMCLNLARRDGEPLMRMVWRSSLLRRHTTYTPLTPAELQLAQALRDFASTHNRLTNEDAGIMPWSYRSLDHDGRIVVERDDDVVPRTIAWHTERIAAKTAALNFIAACRVIGTSP